MLMLMGLGIVLGLVLNIAGIGRRWLTSQSNPPAPNGTLSSDKPVLKRFDGLADAGASVRDRPHPNFNNVSGNGWNRGGNASSRQAPDLERLEGKHGVQTRYPGEYVQLAVLGLRFPARAGHWAIAHAFTELCEQRLGLHNVQARVIAAYPAYGGGMSSIQLSLSRTAAKAVMRCKHHLAPDSGITIDWRRGRGELKKIYEERRLQRIYDEGWLPEPPPAPPPPRTPPSPPPPPAPAPTPAKRQRRAAKAASSRQAPPTGGASGEGAASRRSARAAKRAQRS